MCVRARVRMCSEARQGSAHRTACFGLAEGAEAAEGVSSAASRARVASRAPSSSIEQTSDMAKNMERSSSEASLHTCNEMTYEKAGHDARDRGPSSPPVGNR